MFLGPRGQGPAWRFLTGGVGTPDQGPNALGNILRPGWQAGASGADRPAAETRFIARANGDAPGTWSRHRRAGGRTSSLCPLLCASLQHQSLSLKHSPGGRKTKPKKHKKAKMQVCRHVLSSPPFQRRRPWEQILTMSLKTVRSSGR